LRDDELDLVARHSEVEALDAHSDAITDQGLASLSKATGIRDLSIQSRQITDKGVAALCEMPRLRYLTLHSPLLTNATLEHLAGVPTLRSVSLNGNTQITHEQEKAFRRARPNVWLKVERAANTSAGEID